MPDNKALTLSLIILAYNEQDHLKACLDAIAAQSEPPNEVIVVDNNSTDQSVKIAMSYSFVKVIKETKQGMSYARNAGFKTARSLLLARIDADSQIDTDYIAWIKQTYIEADQPDLYAAASTVSFRNSGPGQAWFWLHRLTYFWPARLLLGDWPIYGPTTVISKQLFNKIKTCNYNWIHEDMDLTWHVHRTGIRTNFSKQPHSNVLARKMIRRAFYYPLMMVLARFSPRHFYYGRIYKKR